MKNRGYSRILAAALILTAGGGCFLLGKTEPQRPNILWITMDSLRADHLGCAGYQQAHTPNIDALAAEGTFFNQAVSQASYTDISVPSMITGKYPYRLGIRMLGSDVDSTHLTLAEMLAADGYFTCGILEPWSQGFYQGLEKIHQGNSSTAQKTEWCLEALDALDDRPFFIWLYYWDPHAPYTPEEKFMKIWEPEYTLMDGRPYGRDMRDATGLFGGPIILLSRLNQGKLALTPEEKVHLIRLYDAEISLVDDHIRQVVDKLKGLGLWENTLVILNADHGEAFGEHGVYYHGHTLYETQVRVPLIIRPPQTPLPGGEIDGPVRNMDIMPTVLDYCGIDPPADLDGQSLRPYLETDISPSLPSCLETHSVQSREHRVAYRDGQYKLIYNLSQKSAELYDLTTDPQESLNLLVAKGVLASGEDPELRENRLREKLLDALGVESLALLEMEWQLDSIDPEARERLKALGYIE